MVLSKDARRLEQHSSGFDFILDTVSAPHDIDAYLNPLTRDGALDPGGATEKPLSISAFSLIAPRRQLAASVIGGIPETREMLDFRGRHGIVSDIEIIPIQKITYERMLTSDVKYRLVIDMASLK